MELAGKIALVTGASGGLGRAIALELAGRGADIIVHFTRNRDQAQAVADAVVGLGRRARVVRGDVRHVDEVDALVAEGVAALGGLDILVNNAGVAEQEAPSWDLAAWEHLVAVNLSGKFLCVRAAREHLRARHGVVINISSTSGYNPTYGYGVTKVGVNGLTYWLAQELAPDVRVVGVAPGYIEAGFNGDHSPEIRQKVAAKTLLGRNGKAIDVARAVAWLAGPEASFITGETLMVGGGIHLRL
jgi:3-oxoacyl-[acyl-carrier protein] reductase